MEHNPPEHPHPQLATPEPPLPDTAGPLTVRQPSPREVIRHRAAVDSAYGFPFRPQSPQDEARMATNVPPHNQRIVVEQLPDGGERIIGGDIRFDLRLSLPGGRRVAAGALSAVGVEPSAQGRGAMRALVDEHLDECRARGEAASVLMASQSSLYPRFGYGLAAQTAHWEIDANAAGLRPDAPTAGGVTIEHARGEALHELLNATWEAASSARAGGLSRSPAWWNTVLSPNPGWPGGGPIMVARHASAPGYVLYTVSIEDGRQGLMEAAVTVRELVAADVGAELDLWRYIARLPWARTITWRYAPIDPAPLFWLTDPRQLRRTAHFDFLWLRPLDMAALVAQRRFSVDGQIALRVGDPRYPDLAGRFDLRVNGGAGSWEPGSGEASLHVSIADLGALWLGGASAAQLLSMRRISGHPAAALRLDAMLATDGPPRCVSKF